MSTNKDVLKVDNLDKLNPFAVKIATAIICAKFGPERCSCCRQSIPRDEVGDVIAGWANEYVDDSGKAIADVHAAILDVLIIELSLISPVAAKTGSDVELQTQLLATRTDRDALALQVLTLTNERDDARALARCC